MVGGSRSGLVATAVAAWPSIAWSGDIWRCYARRYSGDDASGSFRISGRYDRGTDKNQPHETWPALYTGLSQHIALGERICHTSIELLPLLAEQRITRLQIDLHAVLNGCASVDCVAPLLAGYEL